VEEEATQMKEYILKDRINPKPQIVKPSLPQFEIKSNQKLIISGDIWETYEFFDDTGHPFKFCSGKEKANKGEKKAETDPKEVQTQDRVFCFLDRLGDEEAAKMPPWEKPSRTPEEQQADRERHASRAKKAAQRYINANKLKYMWTLTFAPEPNPPNVKDVTKHLPLCAQRNRQEILQVWHTFERKLMQAYKRRGIDWKYVMVLERHEKRSSEEKRDTFHIHLATNVRVKKESLQKKWGYGIVWISNFDSFQERGKKYTYSTKKVSRIDDPGRYLAKYIGKGVDASQEGNQRNFLASHNLKKPTIFRDPETIKNVLFCPLLGYQLADTFFSDELGRHLEKLSSIKDVKVFQEMCQFDLCIKNSEQIVQTVKVNFLYTIYNFRTLLDDP
jgi:hypothetical protein